MEECTSPQTTCQMTGNRATAIEIAIVKQTFAGSDQSNTRINHFY